MDIRLKKRILGFFLILLVAGIIYLSGIGEEEEVLKWIRDGMRAVSRAL